MAAKLLQACHAVSAKDSFPGQMAGAICDGLQRSDALRSCLAAVPVVQRSLGYQSPAAASGCKTLAK
jgi:hypothetical protein